MRPHYTNLFVQKEIIAKKMVLCDCTNIGSWFYLNRPLNRIWIKTSAGSVNLSYESIPITYSDQNFNSMCNKDLQRSPQGGKIIFTQNWKLKLKFYVQYRSAKISPGRQIKFDSRLKWNVWRICIRKCFSYYFTSIQKQGLENGKQFLFSHGANHVYFQPSLDKHKQILQT